MLQRSETNHAACAVLSFAKHGSGVLYSALAMGALALTSSGMAMAQRPAKPVEIPMTPDLPRKGDRIVKADQIRITRQTKFCIHTWFSPAMQKAIQGYPRYYRSFGYRVIDATRSYFKEHKIPLITTKEGGPLLLIPSEISGKNTYCLNDGSNVMLTVHVNVSSNGQPYRVSLIARQSNMVWMKSIERFGKREWPAHNQTGEWLSSSIGIDIMKATDTFFQQSFIK